MRALVRFGCGPFCSRSAGWLLLGLALLALGCEGAGPRAPDVVIVTWDTVRADHVGPSGGGESPTPMLDRLAAEGVSFTETRSPVAITLPAHASLMTGLFPARHGARNNGAFRLREHVPTLAERFAAAGYATAAFVSAAVLDDRYGLARGFAHYDDAIAGGEAYEIAERLGGETIEAAAAWLAAREDDAPVFVWVHLFDPHRAWRAPAPHADAFDPYRAEIAYADAQTGRLLGAIERRGRLDDTIVVVTSDHGEGLGEHGESSHAYFAYDSTLRVPLVFWAGEARRQAWASGARIAGPTSLVDVAPTLLALAGLDPLEVDGVSLVPQLGGETALPRVHPLESVVPAADYGAAPVFGVLDERGEIWFDTPRRERYAPQRDPGQRDDLYSEADAEAADALFAGIDFGWPQTDARLDVDANTRAELEALGYVAGVGAEDAVASAEASTVDPKDRVELFDFLSLGHIVMGPARALERVETLRTRYGELVALDRFELNMLDSLGRSRDALALTERLAASDRPDAAAYRAQAEARRAALGEQMQLAKQIQQAIESGTAPPRALGDLALTLHRLQIWTDAERLYRQAIAASPQNDALRANFVRLLVGDGRPEEALALARAGREATAAPSPLDCLAGRILAVDLRRVEEAEAAYTACRAAGGRPTALEQEVMHHLRSAPTR